MEVIKIFVQSEISEMTDRSIEVTASVLKVEEKLSTAEEIDRKDDERRARARKELREFINAIKNAKTLEELKIITNEYEIKIEKFEREEDLYEELDDQIRYSNIGKTAKIREDSKLISNGLEIFHLREYKANKKDRTCNEHETVSTTY